MDWAIKIANLVAKYAHPDIVVSGRVRDEIYEVKFRARDGGMEVLVDVKHDMGLYLYPKFGHIRTGYDVDRYVEILMLVRNFIRRVEDG